ncbi:MAG: hypothetical protein K0R34_3396, partial [Herbinix sp.]|nr:hypothetical protein [Herbinix sp.]
MKKIKIDRRFRWIIAASVAVIYISSLWNTGNIKNQDALVAAAQ